LAWVCNTSQPNNFQAKTIRKIKTQGSLRLTKPCLPAGRVAPLRDKIKHFFRPSANPPHAIFKYSRIFHPLLRRGYRMQHKGKFERGGFDEYRCSCPPGVLPNNLHAKTLKENKGAKIFLRLAKLCALRDKKSRIELLNIPKYDSEVLE